MMSDSEDDFVEVNGYSSASDSDWEKIGYSSGEETVSKLQGDQPLSQELVQSYYRSPENNSTHQHLLDVTPQVISEYDPLNATQGDKPRNRSRNSKKAKLLKEGRRKQWTKVSLQRGNGAPYDPVEFLGITSGEKALLSHFGITTIGQLAYFNAMDFVSSVDSDKFAVILDLQERAYSAVTAYVTKTSSQLDVVWAYVYLSEEELSGILRKGYIDSDPLYFVWSAMPELLYRDQVAVDKIMGKETKNRDLRGRYTRFIKINLSKLCNKYYGRLYQKDPQNTRAQDKWQPISLMEASDLSLREELWYPFEPGHNIFSLVCHGSIVIPTGKIPKDCIELDNDECKFKHNNNNDIDEKDYDSDCDTSNSILDRIVEHF